MIGARRGQGDVAGRVWVLNRFYVDATAALNWGPHARFGASRIEFEIIRQVLRQNRGHISLFKVDRSGLSYVLDMAELQYLVDLVEGRMPRVAAVPAIRAWARWRVVTRAIRGGAGSSGEEFDDAAAAYVSRRWNRRGAIYRSSRVLVRSAKLLARLGSSLPEGLPDPLAIDGARCLLSDHGRRRLAAVQRNLAAHVATLVHEGSTLLAAPPRIRTAVETREFEWTVANCRKFIASSHSVMEQLATQLEPFGKADPATVVSLPDGSSYTAPLQPEMPQDIPQLRRKRYVLHLPPDQDIREPSFALPVWASLAAHADGPIPALVLIARDENNRRELAAEIARHTELDGCALVLGPLTVAQREWLFRHAQFGICPSPAASAQSLGQALSAELPILAGLEPQTGASSGLFATAPPGDAEAWERILRFAVDDPNWSYALRQRISRQYRPAEEVAIASAVLAIVENDAFAPAPQRIRPAKAQDPATAGGAARSTVAA